MSKVFFAEVIGTFILVFFGCGAAVFMGSEIGLLGISFAFGLSIVAAAYSIGHISGAHLNPAVSLGVLIAGKMASADFLTYVVAQVIGAVIAAFALFRLFDITKPSLVGWADKRNDAVGVMLDDVIAGIMAAIGVLIMAALYHLVLS